MATLDEIVTTVRTSPALAQKAAISVVREVLGAGDWLAGTGDDGAVVDAGGGSRVVVCGEAIFPPFFDRDPYGAGVAAVLTNVNDVAAMGARPLAIVDTITETRRTAGPASRGCGTRPGSTRCRSWAGT